MEEKQIIKFHVWGPDVRVNYIMKKTSKMSTVKKYYSKQAGISVGNLKFTINWNKTAIGDEDTPEILGMKAGDTVHVSFIDDDYYLMEFDPRQINDRGRVKMTYQAMLKMAEHTGELLDVMKKRVAEAIERETLVIKDCVPFHGLNRNLYHLSCRNREKLVKYSVEKLLNVFGSEEEIVRFRNCIFLLAKFIKKCLFNILESLLPATLPYPALSIITSNVLSMKGLDQIGLVTQQDLERKCMEKLFYSLADIFTLLKVLMFNTDSQWYCRSPIYSLAVQKKEDLNGRLQALRELLERSVG